MFSPRKKLGVRFEAVESFFKSYVSSKQLGTWRFLVGAGAYIASAVFVINLSVLIWSSTLEVRNGSATVFEGKAPDIFMCSNPKAHDDY